MPNFFIFWHDPIYNDSDTEFTQDLAGMREGYAADLGILRLQVGGQEAGNKR